LNFLIIKTFLNIHNNIVIYQKNHYNTIYYKDSCLYGVEYDENVHPSKKLIIQKPI
jgi:hypothetical protein